jgi:hypothetical protein
MLLVTLWLLFVMRSDLITKVPYSCLFFVTFVPSW